MRARLPRGHAFVAIVISLASLAAAFYFQHVMGLLPCSLCLVQRWAHVAAIFLAIPFILAPNRFMWVLGLSGAEAVLATGAFHVGVEYGFWAGPAACSGGSDLGAMTASELLDTSVSTPVVSCADPVWAFMGLSMAGWNAVIGLVLTLVWLTTLSRAKRIS